MSIETTHTPPYIHQPITRIEARIAGSKVSHFGFHLSFLMRNCATFGLRFTVEYVEWMDEMQTEEGTVITLVGVPRWTPESVNRPGTDVWAIGDTSAPTRDTEQVSVLVEGTDRSAFNRVVATFTTICQHCELATTIAQDSPESGLDEIKRYRATIRASANPEAAPVEDRAPVAEPA